jgi:hypothetical protein
MPDAPDQAARLEQILKRNRDSLDLDAELPEELLLEIAEIEEQNQFDDNRSKAQKAIRDAVEAAGKAIRLGEVSK